MRTVRDDSGIGLQGAIDGVNRVYRTTSAMRLDRPIEVFVNGACRFADLDNGYILTSPFTVEMRETLLPGDTLAVRYNSSALAASPPYAQPSKPTVTPEGVLGAPWVVSLRPAPPLISSVS